MTKKEEENLKRSQSLMLSWKNRKDYKGYDKTKGSSYYSWRAITNTKKGKLIGFPKKWKDYNIFLKEVQGEWKRGRIVKRIDIKKPYSHNNCFWADKGTENIDKLIKLEYNEEIKTILEWCELYNLNYNGVRQRYFRGKNYTNAEILFGKQKKIKNKRELTKEKKIYRQFHAYKYRDKTKNLENDLDLEFVKNLIKNPCIYCGDTENIGLDRIDNSKGHTKNNVIPCCYICNCARMNNFSFEEMKILGKAIREIKLCRLTKQN